jgi:SM-20-related protein
VPKAEFFQRLGLFAIEGFLDAATCRDLRTAIRSGRPRAGTVGGRGSEFVVDRAYRSVNWVKVDDAAVAVVRSRLLAAAKDVGDFYGFALTDCEDPQFLAYGPGDHYKAHRDSAAHSEATATSKARRISTVVFLNRAAEPATDDSYGGGALTFFGLVPDPSGKSLGIPLEADEGLLITFPSEMLHAVEPVTHGERYTIASWYH